jgi:hypothetical protein
MNLVEEDDVIAQQNNHQHGKKRKITGNYMIKDVIKVCYPTRTLTTAKRPTHHARTTPKLSKALEIQSTPRKMMKSSLSIVWTTMGPPVAWSFTATTDDHCAFITNPTITA